jgi:hypothetical protein
MNENYLSRSEAARYLGLSYRTIGKLPIQCIKFPATSSRDHKQRYVYRYKTADLEQFKQMHTVQQAD